MHTQIFNFYYYHAWLQLRYFYTQLTIDTKETFDRQSLYHKHGSHVVNTDYRHHVRNRRHDLSSLRSLAVTNSSALKRAAKPRGTACPDDLHFLLPPLITYFVNLMTGFVDPFIPANHSAGRNIKLPICREMDSQGKATMKHITAVLSNAVCLLDGDTPKKPVKGGIDRNGKDNCRLCCCLLKIKFGKFKKTSYISSQNRF